METAVNLNLNMLCSSPAEAGPQRPRCPQTAGRQTGRWPPRCAALTIKWSASSCQMSLANS